MAPKSNNNPELKFLLETLNQITPGVEATIYLLQRKRRLEPVLSTNKAFPAVLNFKQSFKISKEELKNTVSISPEELEESLHSAGIQALIPLDAETFLAVHDSLSVKVLARPEMARLLRAVVELRREVDREKRNRRQMLEEISALHDVGRSIQSARNLDALLNFIMKKCMEIMNSEAGSLMLVVPDSDELEFKVALGPKSDGVKPFRVKIGQGISGWVAQHKEPILIPDAYADPRFDPSFDKRSGFRTRSYLCVPMLYQEDVLGVMTVLNRKDGQPFSENDLTLLTTFAAQAAIAIENARLVKSEIEMERLERELQIAAEIQRHLIPEQVPQIPDLEISATYRPCKEVGGDFYDIIPLNNRKVIFVMADVAGKGVPGALQVATMQASLRAYLEFSQDLKEVVEKLNRLLIDTTMDDGFITFFIMSYDLDSHTIQYINAGHNPPLIVSEQGEIKELNKGGIFLGFQPWAYEQEEVPLAVGSVVVAYTDGLVEAMNTAEKEFGENRLKALLKTHRASTSEQIQSTIIQQVTEFIGDNPLQDDFTLLVVKRN